MKKMTIFLAQMTNVCFNFWSLFLVQIQENTMLEGKIRALEDDRERLIKSLNNLQNAAENPKSLRKLRKEIYQLKWRQLLR